jgi:histidinol-phosphate aminotransferase
MNSLKTSEPVIQQADNISESDRNMLRDLLRPDLQDWTAYSSARNENSGQAENPIFLDANENPFGKWNRYPDPIQTELREELAIILDVDSKQLFLGNGSDEIIDLLIRCYCSPQKDEILSFSPGFSMYAYAARLSNVKCSLLPLDEQWQIPSTAIEQIKEIKPKITFICSPNNPTGNSLSTEDIELIIQESPGLVVVDEAYIEFSEQKSFTEKLNSYPNLLILRTMSKAWALAGIRLGILIANPLISDMLQSFKMPYNISSANQQEALAQLRNREVVSRQIETILEERNRLEKVLPEYDLVERCFPSDSNFLLVQFKSSQKVYEELKAQNCLVRDRSKLVSGALRISIGSPEENQALLQALKNIQL